MGNPLGVKGLLRLKQCWTAFISRTCLEATQSLTGSSLWLPYVPLLAALQCKAWPTLVFFPSSPLPLLNSDKYRYHVCNYSADFISVTVSLVWAAHSVVRDTSTSLCSDNHFPVPPTLRHHLPSSSSKYATLLCQCNSKSHYINKLLYRFLLPFLFLFL